MSGTPPTSPHHAPIGRRLLTALALTVVALAVGAFTLSFDALRALAISAGVTVHLAWLWPLIVDGFIVIATAAAVMLRDRGWRVAWYPWATLILFAGVSVAGNAHHAASHADRTAVSVSVAALVSAVPALALLLASHLLVVLLTPSPAAATGSYRTPVAETTQIMTVDNQGIPRADAGQPHASGSPAHREAIPEPTRSTRIARPVNEPELEAWITTRLKLGEPVTGASIAQHFDCSPATGRRRLAELRRARPELAHQFGRQASTQEITVS